ncbi:MAG: PilZ domain-containing protein [Bradymonadaceae bacterium]|nr:PilZ domain-containing protein [Lujinxingiaceae bacterium]
MLRTPSNPSQIRRAPIVRPSFAGLRKHARKPLALQILIQDADGWEIPLDSIDLSPAGMFVRSNFLFETGDVHTLIFKSPEGDCLFRIRARVVRVEHGPTLGQYAPSDFMPGMAYEFVELGSEMSDQLQGLVAGV